MSSKKTMMNLCKVGICYLWGPERMMVCCISRRAWRETQWLLWVLKAVLLTSSSFIRIWWYPCNRSSFEDQQAHRSSCDGVESSIVNTELAWAISLNQKNGGEKWTRAWTIFASLILPDSHSESVGKVGPRKAPVIKFLLLEPREGHCLD